MKFVRLEEIVDILDGMRVPINSAERAKRKGTVPYYGATGQVGTIDKAIFNETLILLGEDGVPFFDPTKHKAYEISGPSWVNNHAHVLRAKSELVVQRYLLHFLNQFNYAGYVNGATRLKLTQGDMRRIPILLPSLEEQQEIVEKLDSSFANIDLLEGNLELSNEKASQLLQSLLSSAFSLTADENKSSNSSRDDFISPKLVSLGTLAEVIAGQSPEGIYYNSNGQGIPFYQGKKEFGDKFLGAPTTWTTKITKLAQSGDILMSVRAPVGPINFATQEICIGRGLASIRASKLINKDFLYYFLLHKQPEISGNTGAVFNSINKEQIASIELPVPSLERQQKIVERLENAFAEIELLKAQIRIKKDYAAALRQSLLSSAFTQEESVA